MRSTKPTEIEQLIFCESAENTITRNTLKINQKALELSSKAFMILSILEKVKRTILLVPYQQTEKPLQTPEIWQKTLSFFFTSIIYLKHSNLKTFFLSPTTPNEIKNIINSIKSSKCVGPNSIPTKILHLIKDKISIPLS